MTRMHPFAEMCTTTPRSSINSVPVKTVSRDPVLTCLQEARMPHNLEPRAPPCPGLPLLRQQQARPDTPHKMSAQPGSHDSFVLTKSPHAQICRSNSANRPNNASAAARSPRTVSPGPVRDVCGTNSSRFSSEKSAAILWKACAEKKRGTPQIM